jgi:homocysteine S-methyltransferase
MINCAHPTHFEHVLANGGVERIRGLRANSSALSHAELDEAEELDAGNPVELAGQYVGLRPLLPNLTVVGGCCGTDQRHVRELAAAWSSASV